MGDESSMPDKHQPRRMLQDRPKTSEEVKAGGTITRHDGPYLILLGLLVFLSVGLLYGAINIHFIDFNPPYYTARCLLRGVDPYMERNVLAEYKLENPAHSLGLLGARQSAIRSVYPPTTLLLFAPIALLPAGVALPLWLATITSAFVIASYAIWRAGAKYAPALSGVMVCVCVANSEVILSFGNVAGLAVSLCALAAWAFIEEKFVRAGVLALAISLVLKPQDAAFVWVYFMLAGGEHRKRMWQTFAVALALCIPAVIWTTAVSPHWLQEMRANLSQIFSYGDINDPGPHSAQSRGIGMIVNLQTVFSRIRDDSRFYDAATYAIATPLFLAWGWVSRITHRTREHAWLGLAAISALTLMPIYHRLADVPLILLTIPACCILWAEGRTFGKVAAVLTAIGFVLTSELFWLVAFLAAGKLLANAPRATAFRIANLFALPVPLILTVLGIFYLWAFATRGTLEKAV